jgi:DEAD/DEAH box helicase domain-containing protein
VEATLGTGKIGSGLDSLRWWKNGEVEKVRKYCLEDVRLTKELYDWARLHGKVKYRDGKELKEILLPNAKKWEEFQVGTLTHTLPF